MPIADYHFLGLSCPFQDSPFNKIPQHCKRATWSGPPRSGRKFRPLHKVSILKPGTMSQYTQLNYNPHAPLWRDRWRSSAIGKKATSPPPKCKEPSGTESAQSSLRARRQTKATPKTPPTQGRATFGIRRRVSPEHQFLADGRNHHHHAYPNDSSHPRHQGQTHDRIVVHMCHMGMIGSVKVIPEYGQ